jgi:hypothetical protein
VTFAVTLARLGLLVPLFAVLVRFAFPCFPIEL